MVDSSENYCKGAMTEKLSDKLNLLPSALSGFTFIGSGLEREALPTVAESANPLTESAFPLAQAKAGDRLCVVGFKGDTNTMQHLSQLGIHPGAAVRIISRSLSGSVIMTLAGKRLGLGRQMAQQVMVCEG